MATQPLDTLSHLQHIWADTTCPKCRVELIREKIKRGRW